jgi:subtilisin family serine protease
MGLVLAIGASWSGGRGAPAPQAAAGRATELHVKLKDARASFATFGAMAAPLFGELPAGTHDDRARWVRVEVVDSSVAAVLEMLRHDPNVEEAFPAPTFTLAKAVTVELRRTREDPSCPITTPSFESYQGYLGPAPHGIDAPAAWRRGYRGAGVWFADVEGGWNTKHEDLPGDRITHVAGRPMRDPGWQAHGTAVLGEVVGRDNGKGVVGIAPDVERVFTASISGVAVADAIDRTARRLRAGDVLLIELQTAGPRGRWLPVEYWDDVYDAIRAATDRGVVIIEAAGNGAENLDHPEYERKFDRARRDSGAIMIGAGGPPRDGFRDREKLDFSNYGGRVDVQGWGRKVATLDYGDLQACDEAEDKAPRDRHYTNEFSGTSSASPIVAGAAVILEGVARAKGRVLAPRELRDLLRRTGTPQAGDTSLQIGPRPDLARAIDAL